MANPELNVDASSESQEPVVPATIDYEKRFKDTQGAFTKSQQELKALQARNKVLEEMSTPQVVLDEAAETELNDLKFSDPDAWRAKLNQLELEAQNSHRDTLNEAERVVTQATELENREQIFRTFQANNPGLVITDDTIKYDIPPRISNKLETGVISFEAYLEEVGTYLSTGKVVGSNAKPLGQPDLGAIGGNSTTPEAGKGDLVSDYNNLVF